MKTRSDSASPAPAQAVQRTRATSPDPPQAWHSRRAERNPVFWRTNPWPSQRESCRATLGPGATAARAVAGAGKANFLFAPERRLFERHFQRIAQFLAGRALAPGAEQVAKDGVEEIGNRAEVGLGAEGHVASDAAETVVVGTLVFIAQHGVGHGDLFEPLLGRMVAGIAIGVVLQGEPPVRGLDLRRRGLAIDAQDLVGITCWRASHGADYGLPSLPAPPSFIAPPCSDRKSACASVSR